MITTRPHRGPVTSTEEERLTLQEAERLLGDHPGQIALSDEHGHRIELPETAARLVRRVVQALATGNPVEVNVLPKALTISQAAEILDLRREDVVRLLDEGEILFVEDESGLQRIRFEAVMAYKPKRDAERRAALDEIARIGQEMGGTPCLIVRARLCRRVGTARVGKRSKTRSATG